MSTVRESARREGVDLIEANRQALGGGQTGGRDTQPPTQG
jgi:hypothetical protein